MSTPLSFGSPMSASTGGFHISGSELDNIHSARAYIPFTLSSSSNDFVLGNVNMSRFDVSLESSAGRSVNLSSSLEFGSLDISGELSHVAIQNSDLLSMNVSISSQTILLNASSITAATALWFTLSEPSGYFLTTGTTQVNITVLGGSFALHSSNSSVALPANLSSPIHVAASNDLVLTSIRLRVAGTC